jgi:hypothetical protein
MHHHLDTFKEMLTDLSEAITDYETGVLKHIEISEQAALDANKK